jgi:hypothetical protein
MWEREVRLAQGVRAHAVAQCWLFAFGQDQVGLRGERLGDR